MSGILPARSLVGFPEDPDQGGVSSLCRGLRVGTGLTPAHHRLQPSSDAGCFPGEATGSRTRPLPDDCFRIKPLPQAGTGGEDAGERPVENTARFLHRAILLLTCQAERTAPMISASSA
jgi:hypothetical protein